MKIMSQDDYLFANGVGFCTSGYCLDKLVLPHGETQRQRKRRLKESNRVEAEYQATRAEKIEEYNQLVAENKLRAPTSFERIYRTAVYGHPDNVATQAARRLLYKRGFIMVYQN